jgi:hypothetical protein
LVTEIGEIGYCPSFRQAPAFLITCILPVKGCPPDQIAATFFLLLPEIEVELFLLQKWCVLRLACNLPKNLACDQ